MCKCDNYNFISEIQQCKSNDVCGTKNLNHYSAINTETESTFAIANSLPKGIKNLFTQFSCLLKKCY